MELALVSTVLDPNAAFPVSSRLYAVILLLPFWDTKTLFSWTTRPDGLDSPEDKTPHSTSVTSLYSASTSIWDSEPEMSVIVVS